MHKRCVLGSLVLAVVMGAALGFCILPCFAEDITITTYYPAPYGVYNQMATRTLGVGDTDADGDIDENDAPDPAGDPGDVWIAGNVGIGTSAPTCQLQVGLGVASATASKAPTFRMIGDCMTIEDGSPELWFVDTDDTRYWSIHNSGGYFYFDYTSDDGASWTKKITFDENGNVGIGETNPTARLHINGNIKAVLSSTVGGPDMKYNPGSDEIGYDIAEIFEANEEVEPADVLCIGEDGKLQKSNKEYDTTVAGIVSAAPAILFEGSQLQIAPQPFTFQRGKKLPLALAGRVSCNVTTENGPVNCGDLLVTSSKSGYAMKANPDKLKPGMILAKALEPLKEGEGKILVLIK